MLLRNSRCRAQVATACHCRQNAVCRSAAGPAAAGRPEPAAHGLRFIKPWRVALFGADCYWRDLISFTWNICTQESPDQVRAMLAARLDDVAPSNWQLEGDATEAGGITEAWFTFETRLSRGRGLLRLKEEDGQSKAWTLLTTMVELKGHEEKTGEHRIGAPSTACTHRKSWAELKAEEAAQLGHSVQPEVVIVGGGQGGIALARGCGGWACRTS
jgi:putative flavoprotein involved in K+ transport